LAGIQLHWSQNWGIWEIFPNQNMKRQSVVGGFIPFCLQLFVFQPPALFTSPHCGTRFSGMLCCRFQSLWQPITASRSQVGRLYHLLDHIIWHNLLVMIIQSLGNRDQNLCWTWNFFLKIIESATPGINVTEWFRPCPLPLGKAPSEPIMHHSPSHLNQLRWNHRHWNYVHPMPYQNVMARDLIIP
jgi:hypothetical protein